MSETWTDDWDDRLATPAPLPSYPGPSEAPQADAAGASPDANQTRWSLVSLDGRATMRIPKRFVIGSSACCDLCLTERGIASHHAMLTVEEGVAYVTALSDAPSLLDGRAIVRRERLHRDAALTFGAATFRVEHEGPLEEPPTEAPAQVAGEAAASHHATRPHEPHPPRMSTPHITPQVDLAARSEHRAAPVQRRKSRTGFVVVVVALLMAAAAWWVPRDFVDTQAFRTEPQPIEAVSPNAQIAAAAAVPPTASAPPSQVPPTATESPAADASSALLSEADALYAKGNLVAPRGRNAAERYVRVLQESPDSKIARERLDQIVGRVALGAEGMILGQRFDAARQSMEQLAAAIPQRSALIGKQAQGRWRVVDLLLQADALMQQYRLVAPDDPNAVALLREALRVEPRNAIADEMLSKAYGLLEVRRNQDAGVASTQP